MSSTSNSQNLLVNVFRPTYVYDAEKGYIPKLTVSNVDSVVGTSGTFSNLNVGDTKSNVYIGVNAGNPNTVVESCNSTGITAIGLSAGSNTSNSDGSVFLGNSTGSNTSNVDNSVYLGALTGTYNSNCANSVYIGYNSAKNLSNASNEVAIGTNTIAGGTSNVYIGASTGSAGSSNIFIGPNIAPGNVSNQLRVGTGSNIAIYGDLTAQKVGINTVPTTGFDVSGQAYFNNKVGMQCNAPRFSLDVEGQAYASGGILIGEGSAAAPAIALADELSTGIFAASNVGEGRSFGFSIKGTPKVTVTDTCLNVLANLYVQGTFGAATQFGANQIVTGWLRGPDSNGGNFDVSQSGISVGRGTVNIGKGFITDVCTNGYIRMMNDGGAIQIDMSGGNISNSATTRSSNFIGTSATASNQIGGVTLSNNNISYSGTITGSSANTSNVIGGVTLSNNNISYSGTITGSSANTSNQIGGVTLSNNNISYSGTITGSTANTSNQIGGVTLSNNNISYSGTITGSTATASNQIGGVTLSNNNISYSGTITGSTATASNQIGGVTLSNNNVSYSGTITGSTANTSNRIGGVVLSNTDVSATGRILGGTTTSNNIGGVTLSNTRIGIGDSAPVYPLVVTSSTLIPQAVISNSSGEANLTVAGNRIQDFGIKLLSTTNAQGLYSADLTAPMTFSTRGIERARILANGSVGINQTNPVYQLDVNGTARFAQGVTLDSTITSTTANTSNVIGGVVLSNNDISYSGTITGSTANTSNRIGGVVLSNGNVDVSDGTAPNPTFSFINDLSTGIHLANKNTLAFDTAGTLRMCISGTNVGIGNAIPRYTLDVSGTTASSNFRAMTSYDIFSTFTPTQIPGCVLWLDVCDSASITASGGTVSQWSDKSSSSNNFSQATSGNRPTLTAEGLVSFSSGKSLASINNNPTTGAASRTVIVVMRAAGASDRMMFATGTAVGTGAFGFDATRSGSQLYTPFTIGYDIFYNSFTSGNPLISFASYDSNTQTLSGRAITSTAGFGTLTSSNTTALNTTATPWYLGSNFNGSSANGLMYEFIQYNTALTTTQRELLEGYLAWKWGIQTYLPSGHTFSNSNVGASMKYGTLTLENSSNPYMRIGYATVTGLVDISGGNIGYSGTITGSTANTSNRIGGVTLSNTRIGIGDNAPAYPLVVTSSTLIPQAVFSNPSGEANITVAGNKSQDLGIKLLQTSTIQGLYTADDTLPMTFSTSATERIRITSAGNVGIGTRTPGSLLDISSASASQIVNLTSSLTGTGGANGVYHLAPNITGGTLNAFVVGKNTTASNNGAIRYTHLADGASSNYISLTNSSTGGLNVTQEGKVGIGMTNPVRRLDISSNQDAGGVRVTCPNALFEVFDPRNGNNSIESLQLYQNQVTGNQGLYTASSTIPLAFWTANAIRMTILGNGNVGIGTQTPQYPLAVYSTVTVGIQVLSSTNAGIRLAGSGSADTAGFQIFHNSAENGIYDSNTLPLNIYRNGSRQITVLSNGLTGFGTATPAYRLDVTAAAGSAAINMNTWPRFPASNILFVSNCAACTGKYAITFSNTAQAIDSNIITYTRSTTNGDSFVINRSGIYSIAVRVHHNANTWTLWISTTDPATGDHQTNQYGDTSVIATSLNNYLGALTYTGYFDSNSAKSYNIKTSAAATSSAKGSLCVVFHGETPTISGFP